MQHFTDQDLSPAIIRRILAQRPDLQLFFDALEQLRQERRSGHLTLSIDLDFSELNTSTAELAATTVMAIRG